METEKANQSRPILVIDDDPRFCAWVTAALTGTGFEVLSARDGPSGIELARVARPAVILLDMLLPGMDGIATCKRLKRDRALGGIPVLGVTAAPDLRYTEQAFHAGAEFFLAKPIRANSLAQIVELAAKRAQRTAGSRAFSRFQVELPVRCCVPGDAETTREIAGQTGNVSLDGVLLFLPERLPPGIVLSLQLALPKGPLPAEGAVVWQDAQATDNGRFRHGIRLVRFTDDSGLMVYRRYLSQIAAGTSA